MSSLLEKNNYQINFNQRMMESIWHNMRPTAEAGDGGTKALDSSQQMPENIIPRFFFIDVMSEIQNEDCHVTVTFFEKMLGFSLENW